MSLRVVMAIFPRNNIFFETLCIYLSYLNIYHTVNCLRTSSPKYTISTQYLRHYLYTALLQVAKVSVGGHGPGARGREVGAGAVPQELHQRVLLYYILYCIKFIFVKLREWKKGKRPAIKPTKFFPKYSSTIRS